MTDTRTCNRNYSGQYIDKRDNVRATQSFLDDLNGNPTCVRPTAYDDYSLEAGQLSASVPGRGPPSNTQKRHVTGNLQYPDGLVIINYCTTSQQLMWVSLGFRMIGLSLDLKARLAMLQLQWSQGGMVINNARSPIAITALFETSTWNTKNRTPAWKLTNKGM